MISVLIETRDDEQALARTLASLVGGAVDGLVKEVIVCDLGSSDGTAQVAEHAGCVFLAGTDAADAAGKARGEWLLLLKPGARLVAGWIEPTREHISASTAPATFSRSRQTELSLLSRLLRKRDRLAEGLLLRKGDASPKRPTRLRAEIHAV